MEEKEQRRHEFRVVINDIELDEDTLQRVNAAVQKAAISELASADLSGDFRLRFPFREKPIIGPFIWGIWIDPIAEDIADQIGSPEEFPRP